MSDFKDIWLPYSVRFYRVAYHLLESQQDAEDAVQTLYLKLWDSRDRMSEIKNPLAYGIFILKNICIDRIRRRSARKAEPLDATVLRAESSPDSVASAKELLKIVMAEIDRLPGKQAAVMKLLAKEGLGYEEISERTGLSEVHVRVLVSTARRTLNRKTGI